MRSEEEKITEEIHHLKDHPLITLYSDFSEFVHSSEFKPHFTTLPKAICNYCGKDYRVMHWCDSIEQELWISDWAFGVRSLFESHQSKKRDELSPKIDGKQLEEIRLQNMQQEARLKGELEKEKLRNEELQKEIERMKKEPGYIPRPEGHYTNTSEYAYGKKLSVDKPYLLSPSEKIVFEKLREWRRSQAIRENMPAYIIAHDSVLKTIAHYKISSLSELRRVYGIGRTKIEKYGPAILEVLRQSGTKIDDTPLSNNSVSHHSAKYSSHRGSKKTVESISILNAKEKRVYEQLRKWRNAQAQREHTRPYIIAHNSALMAIVYYKISSLKELIMISGFSKRKAEKYGHDILRIMNQNMDGSSKIIPLPAVARKKEIILGLLCITILAIIIVLVLAFA